jgi:hypothetical protein
LALELASAWVLASERALVLVLEQELASELASESE